MYEKEKEIIKNKDNEKDKNTQIEEDNFYNKVKRRLEQNKESDNIKEKVRIMKKHKEDKIKAKEKDYEKHGIEIEDDENLSDINIEEDNINNEINTSSNKLNDIKKININVEHSTIKEKEKAALELLKMKNKLFS